MVASGVTAKGLKGIEAEANKLAKAPKGIDGVTEGAGNLAEDVGTVSYTHLPTEIDIKEYLILIVICEISIWKYCPGCLSLIHI